MLAAYGWRKARQHGLPVQLAALHLGIALVGVGSFLFHGTLLYETQLMDELPMLFASSICARARIVTSLTRTVTYTVYAQRAERYSQPQSTFLLAFFILAFDTIVTVIYLRYPNPVFHQVAYAFIQLITILRTVYLLRNTMRSTPLEDRRRRELTRLLVVSSLIFGLGFAIWNVECAAWFSSPI